MFRGTRKKLPFFTTTSIRYNKMEKWCIFYIIILKSIFKFFLSKWTRIGHFFFFIISEWLLMFSSWFWSDLHTNHNVDNSDSLLNVRALLDNQDSIFSKSFAFLKLKYLSDERVHAPCIHWKNYQLTCKRSIFLGLDKISNGHRSNHVQMDIKDL